MDQTSLDCEAYLEIGPVTALNAPCSAAELGFWLGVSSTEIFQRRREKHITCRSSKEPFSKTHRDLGLALHRWALEAQLEPDHLISKLGWSKRKLKLVLVGRGQLELLDLKRLADLGFHYPL